MQRPLTAVVLILLLATACTTVKQAPTDPRLAEAQKAFEEGQKLKEAQKYAEAVPLVERALEMREAIFGASHPNVASCLHLLGDIHLQQADHARAEPLLQRALSIREVTLGKNHPDVAHLLNSLAHLYTDQGLYARAEPLLKRALAIREATLGEHHPEVATSLNSLANLYTDQGLYAQAEPLYERALAIWETALGKSHPNVAKSLNNLAILYIEQGLYARAEPLLERALSIREAAFGKNHPEVAISLNSFAGIYLEQGLYARAEPLLKRVLAIWEETLGTNHPNVAHSLHNLAALYSAQGLYARVEPLLKRALAIWEAALGTNHPDVAHSLNSLAKLYMTQGHYARAEPLYERTLAIWEAALGMNHPNVATSLNNLANLYSDQGLYARAEPLYERALVIREAALGKNHPDTASLLNNLSNLYIKQGLYARAEPLHERALAIWEAALGKNHPNIATSLNNLADLYTEKGLYARAEPLFEHALALREAALGKNHPEVAYSLNSLAKLYMTQGLYARAAPLYERTLAIWEPALGKNHPEVANSLSDLAWLRLAQQRLAEALPLFERAFTASETHLRQDVFGFSEARLASLLPLLREQEERLYALVRAYPEDARVRRLALSAALLRKGRSAEELADTSRLIFRSLGQADREIFERLRALRTQFSTLSLSGPGALSPADYQQRLKELADESNALEEDLAERSAPLRALSALPPPAEVIDHVARNLPGDGVLIEFVAYHDSSFGPKPGIPPSQSTGELRYLALLLFADGRTHALDLGPAEPINSAALRLHDALARRAVSYQPAARALYALTFRPLIPLLGKARRLFLSPDSQLTLVPFAALHDGSRFLVDALDITYLTSGKDLLPRPEDLPTSRSVVVLADPQFGLPLAAPSLAAQDETVLAERSAALERFFSTRLVPLADHPWPPLPGTRKEAETIQHLLPHAQLLLGPAATKDALLKLKTPGLLHIATHGYFLEDPSAPAAARAVVTPSLIDSGPAQRPADPLLRSGLVLAGAHAQPGSRRLEDSLMTALELAGMNLWGTQLVVLSACDTGRGDVKLGQGVYGLRRALVVAGAETVVTSLWKVNDETTQELMEGYYRKLLDGQGRAAALREAMRELRAKRPHPYHWAPFIAIGQDAPLLGLAPNTPVQTAR